MRLEGTRVLSPQDRICTKCDSGSVEDECHFLLNCAKYDDDRNLIFQIIHKNFSNLYEKDKLIWLMNTEDKAILIALSNFIAKNCK